MGTWSDCWFHHRPEQFTRFSDGRPPTKTPGPNSSKSAEQRGATVGETADYIRHEFGIDELHFRAPSSGKACSGTQDKTMTLATAHFITARRLAPLLIALCLGCDPAAAPEQDDFAVTDGGKQDDATDGAPSLAQGLDVCDVSLLYPMPRDRAQIEALPGLDLPLDGGGELLPRGVFDAALAALIEPRPAGPGIDPSGDGTVPSQQTLDFDSWRVVGIRFDPLAPDPRTGAKKSQIRLVAQPFFVDTGGFAQVQDMALHLVFDLPSSDPAANQVVARALLDLKQASPAVTTGVPLGVHPGLAASVEFGGSSSGFVAEVEGWLQRHLAEAVIDNIAAAGLRSGGDVWVFAAAARQPDGTFSTLGLPLVGGSPFIELNLDQQDLRDVVYDPEPIGGTSLLPMFSIGSPEFDAARTLVHRVDNPELSHIGNVDCVSCHVSTQRLYFTATFDILERIDSLFGFDPSDPNRFEIPEGITGYVRERDAQRQLWHVGNFRYFNGRPSIAVRTVNESAHAADFLNREVLTDEAGTPLSNPLGLSCDDALVAQCFLAGGSDTQCLGPENCEPL
jgi:hypothetical protein